MRLHYPKNKITFPEYDFLESYKTIVDNTINGKKEYPEICDTFRFTRVKRLIYSPYLEDIMKFGAAAGLVSPIDGNFEKCKITVMRDGAHGIIHYFGPNKQLEETILKACQKMKDASEFLLPQRLREIRNARKIKPIETIY